MTLFRFAKERGRPIDIKRPKCFLAVAEKTRLFLRTTRAVSITEAGAALIEGTRALVASADAFEAKVRFVRKSEAPVLKVGAIDNAAAGLTARIAQVAEERQTIVNLVAAGTGLAIVPRRTARLQVPGVTFVGLSVPAGTTRSKLILAAAWARGTRSTARGGHGRAGAEPGCHRSDGLIASKHNITIGA
ncbi:hypothetical protein [Vannielia litorea]|uniref:hypothetical protein n=1 Tax=Vannielia litorea TaxID=1217970 RepID=UPI0009412AF5|nr:hypothetical protein [Vannielia litorea]